MNPDYDDPEIDEQWCDEQRERVIRYLEGSKLEYGEVSDWPAWHLAPYLAIWAVQSTVKPDRVGWWVISGDVPTDCVSAENIKNPRAVMRAFSGIWKEVSDYMLRGEPHPVVSIGTPADWPQLGDMLKRRADLLRQFADNDSLWGGMNLAPR